MYKSCIHINSTLIQTDTYITEETNIFVTSADFAALSQFAPTRMGLASQTLESKLSMEQKGTRC